MVVGQQPASDQDANARSTPRAPWLISVAFSTALVFAPLVIGAGFLTARTDSPAAALPTLRQTFDPAAPDP